jgi:hypothetical protein
VFWKLPDGQYLLQGPVEPLPYSLLEGIRLPHGEVIHSAATYYVVMPDGMVARTYPAPWAYSLEDTLYIGSIHVVVAGQLVEFLWKDVFSHDEPEVEQSGVELTGLIACAPGDLPFDPVAVIATYAAAERQATASGKEPFSVGRLEALLDQSPGSLAEREAPLRTMYYLRYPEIRTLAEFAALLRERGGNGR